MTLTVSSGPAPVQTVTVPYVVGQALAGAKTRLQPGHI